jgi:hypothetical protein
MMFYCDDERIFAILLEGNLMDSAKPCRSIFYEIIHNREKNCKV